MTTSCLFFINCWFSFPLKPSVLLYDPFEKKEKNSNFSLKCGSLFYKNSYVPFKDNFKYHWMVPTTVFAGLSSFCLAEILLHSWHFGVQCSKIFF